MSTRDEDYPWDRPFDEAVRRLLPGRWDARVLDQGDVWVDSAGEVHRVEALDDAHLANIVTMLRRDVIRVMVDHELATMGPDGTGDPGSPLSYPSTPLSLRSALGWLERTVLWEALQAELARRGLTAPGAATRIEGTVGVWAVRTHNAIYVLDLDESQVLRLPAPGAGPLRADQNWAPLHDRGQVRLGTEMQLVITVTPGVRTTRTTTPVTGIRRLPAGLSDPALIHQAVTVWGPSPSDPELTAFRTAGFLATAGVVCDYWAGLARLLHNAGIHAPVLIVPRRLRTPDAEPDAADLCLTGPAPAHRGRLQAAVDDVVGFPLPLTKLTDYPADPTGHGVPFSPTTPRTTRPADPSGPDLSRS